MRLIIISGRSGSGKSTALRALEDAGYNSIDNFPAGLLRSLVESTMNDPLHKDSNLAVCIDARNRELERLPEILTTLKELDITCQLIYLDAMSPQLVKRFSETRRRHPLTNQSTDLRQAIDAEAALLDDIVDLADLAIDTTSLTGNQLVEFMRSRVIEVQAPGLSLLFRSFGFKYGVPVDADVVFDLRCLPNPHWEQDLRQLTGIDAPVADYLTSQPEVDQMFDDIARYLTHWLPRFEQNNRMYMTVALGCTGGQHRSVYMAERLGVYFRTHWSSVQVRHRQLTLPR
ncbi:MAG: RNase adapter RapZ [Pseudomonadales bacterium]|jgi:UPF0042 nucleotide-binding protein|nr:RNase adapter RapZ [Pseudomonadales bacterium]MDP6470842.1 RNase adapter RapZ [Pseudomonadales bacterium]MDP6825973.1 RNase adapter RapZ [Pseudomonadales bacterium]MDP6972285.1 RNase adapter RapZ [Pseudomonadales bacterium]|tara:strand:- start:464 stop:1324 length:861 start_codon:yes stop_codon:yes gene_type:complete